MPKCGLCGGDAPRLPSITEEGTCDMCGKKAHLADAAYRMRRRKSPARAVRIRHGADRPGLWCLTSRRSKQERRAAGAFLKPSVAAAAGAFFREIYARSRTISVTGAAY
jgi:hypothetical protein